MTAGDFVGYALGCIGFSISILVLVITAYIPYVAKTDRMWKTEETES